MMKKALIAMSGGVDSSVAAYLIKQEGYDCMGATMKLFHAANCCTTKDMEDAAKVAAMLHIPYEVYNFSDHFKERVIEPFICAYENGMTPNPCVECNRYLKFEKLFAKARELGYDYVVTGHYVRISYNESTGRYELKKASDPTKDQSYVLYSLTQEQLKHTLFPLGNLSKSEVRKFADSLSFVNADKEDSQDICFVPDGKYTDFICDYTKKTYPEGDFIGPDGDVLGTHKGIIRYTIGQRKGLGLSLKESLYVKEVDKESNTVRLCRNEDLFSTELNADRLNLISVAEIKEPLRVKAKVRYRHTEDWAWVTQTSKDSVHVVFDTPQRAITKGQSVVFYDGDIVVGGGRII